MSTGYRRKTFEGIFCHVSINEKSRNSTKRREGNEPRNQSTDLSVEPGAFNFLLKITIPSVGPETPRMSRLDRMSGVC